MRVKDCLETNKAFWRGFSRAGGVGGGADQRLTKPGLHRPLSAQPEVEAAAASHSQSLEAPRVLWL